MGAASFSIDPALVHALRAALPLRVFVETGTYLGEGVETARRYFDEVYSIEASEEFCARAGARFAGDPRVQIQRGDAAAGLARLVPRLDGKPTLFWLDAHWAPGDPAETHTAHYPVLAELAAIGRLSEASVIVIDDARLFLAAPSSPVDSPVAPSLETLWPALRALSPDHRLVIVNDCIVFAPDAAGAALASYARQHAVDGPAVMGKSRRHQTTLAELEEKQREIESLSKIAEERGQLLEEQARVLSALKRRLEVVEEQVQAFEARDRDEEKSRLANRLRNLWAPRIGTLERHGPIPLRVPRRYLRPRPLVTVPVVSIVTPSFNQPTYIEATLQSVLAQEYPALEYIVQDGGSGAETLEIVGRYRDRLRHFESRPDRGQAHALNLGFGRTTGEIMAYLNSDDILLPGAVNYVVHYFNRHPEVDVVYGLRVLIDQKGREVNRWVLPPHDDFITALVDFIPQETLFWRRRIWDRVGGQFDESLQFALDWELILRFREAGGRFVRLPRFLGGFRVHPAQKTVAEAPLGQEEVRRLRHRFFGRDLEGPELMHQIRWYLRRHIVYQKLYRAGLLRY